MSTVQERSEWVAKPPETEEEAKRRHSDVQALLNAGDQRLVDGMTYKWENEKHCAAVFAAWLSEQSKSSIADRLEIVESFALCEERWFRFFKGSGAACEQADFADRTHWVISQLANQWRERHAKT